MTDVSEKLGLDSEPHELKLGRSFDSDGQVAFHSIRYDFKPASVDHSQMATLEVGENNSIKMTVPHIENRGNTVYKGNKRPVQKECVLVIDHTTGEFTLEKLSNNIQLKKTRMEGSSKAQQMAQMAADQNKMKLSPNSRHKKKHSHSSSHQQPAASHHSHSTTSSSSNKRDTEHSQSTTQGVSPVGTMSDSLSSSSDSSSDSESEQETTTQKGYQDFYDAGATESEHSLQSSQHYSNIISEDLQLSESSSDSD